MLSCLLNGRSINNFDYDKETLKKWSKKNILKCPICNGIYEYCHGVVKIPYFRHKDKCKCNYDYTIEVTEEHKQGVIDIYNILKNNSLIKELEIESWIPSTKQRPNIKFKYNNKIYVIEYQCTPIAAEYYERHELYQAAGIIDIWILGAQNYFQKYHKGNRSKRITEIENNINLYYDPNVKKFYKINNNLDEIWFKAKIGEFIKDRTLSYEHIYKYPSGRPSNKYPYPVWVRDEYKVNCSLGIEIKFNIDDVDDFIINEFNKYKDFIIDNNNIYYKDSKYHFSILPNVNKIICLSKRNKIVAQKTMNINSENIKKYIKLFIKEVEYIV